MKGSLMKLNHVSTFLGEGQFEILYLSGNAVCLGIFLLFAFEIYPQRAYALSSNKYKN